MKQIFEEIWIISLKRRADRLERLLGRLEEIGWPFQTPKIFCAIDGDKVGVPRYWRTGGGSYGCLRSHMSILERAIQDDVKSYLVLEDDATFRKTFVDEIGKFLSDVPPNWECLMLGGQHVDSDPVPIVPNIVKPGKGGGIQRTHCYALRGKMVMKELYLTWAQAAVHCDWVMGPCMERFNTYAPDPFLVGQSRGSSDISGQINPTKFWRPPCGNEPIIILECPRTVMEELQKLGFHGGYSRDPGTGIDKGLREVFGTKNMSDADRSRKLLEWIDMIQWEVASTLEPSVCTIWHPKVSANQFQLLIKRPFFTINANSVEEALQQIPPEVFEEQHRRIPVVILKSSRHTMEELRNSGFHTGYWRDETTGEDKGLQEALATSQNELQLSAKLIRITRILDQEAAKFANGVATLWHQNIPLHLLPDKDFHKIVITASSPTDAIAQLERSKAIAA